MIAVDIIINSSVNQGIKLTDQGVCTVQLVVVKLKTPSSSTYMYMLHVHVHDFYNMLHCYITTTRI